MPIERKLAAIMFTDIVGYTAQMSKDEAVAISLLNKQESILKPLILEHNGTYVKSTGDGTLSHFNSAVDAATCAKRFQESIYDDKDLNVRVGVHLGDTIFERGDIRGDGVNIASRLESMAVAGGVFVSKEVHDQLANQKEFEGVSLGLQSMKGVGRLIEVYGLKGDKLSEPNPKEYQDNKIDKHSDDEVPSIAIIPFDNKGADEDVFYAYGISADLISDCSSAGLIRVASLKQIEELGDLTVEEKAKKLDVRYISTGTLWKMGEMFQLSVELYDTKDKKVVWSDRWEESWDNLPSIKGSLSDGLLKALDTTSKVEKKVETTNTEAYEYYLRGKHKYEKRENIDDTTIAQELLQKALKIENEFLAARHLLGNTYLEMGNDGKAIKIYISNLKQAELLDDKRWVANSFYSIGIIMYHYKGDYVKALEYFIKSIDVNQEIGDKIFEGNALIGIGGVYEKRGDYKKAIDYYKRSIQKCEECGNQGSLIAALVNLGNIFKNQGDDNKAIGYYKRSINICKRINSKYGMGYAFQGIGSIYKNQGYFEKALEYYKTSIKIRKDIGDKLGIGDPLFSIGMIFNYMGKYSLALKYLKRSFKIDSEIEHKYGSAYSLCGFGIIYYNKGDYFKTIDYLERSHNIQKEIELDEGMLLWTNTFLYLAYKKLGKIYNIRELHKLIKKQEYIEDYINYALFKLLKDTAYLETAYNQVQEKANAMDAGLGKRFLSYPIPKAIVEEWENVK